ncbi:hypothetical protein [Brumimicrobium sp.]|uniref:hypothetical protein n=1 Tax=Brumimicrobium sp. TaxID=2029867 RepID=UPI003A90277C
MNTILGAQKKDWIYIILAPVFGFVILGLYLFLLHFLEIPNSSTTLAYIIFFIAYSVLFDINHYFSTYYRVFLDKSYYQENKNWMIPALLFITIIPLMAFWWISHEAFSSKGYYFFVFFRKFVLILGFYHLVQQNWGFMALYKKQANERKTKINWDKLSVLSGSFIPLILLNSIDPIWFTGSEVYIFDPIPERKAAVIEWWHQIAYLNFVFAFILGSIALLFKRFQYQIPAKNMALFCLFTGLLIFSILKWNAELVLTTLLVIVSLIFVVSIIQAIRFQISEKSMNWKKWGVLITTLILYFGVILFPIEGDKFIIVAAITLPHNIQYLAFVPSFSKKQFSQGKKDHGLAKKLSQKIVLLFLLGVGFSLVFEFGRTGVNHILPESMNATKVFVSVFFIVLILHHYYLDAVIWKFSKDKDLENTRKG